MYRWPWVVLGVLAATGAVVYLAVSGPRAAVCYTAGVLLAGGVFTFGLSAVRWADRLGPATSMMMALLTYATLVVVLAAVLQIADPRLVDTAAVAAGLVAASLGWVVVQLRMTRPSAEVEAADCYSLPGDERREI